MCMSLPLSGHLCDGRKSCLPISVIKCMRRMDTVCGKQAFCPEFRGSRPVESSVGKYPEPSGGNKRPADGYSEPKTRNHFQGFLPRYGEGWRTQILHRLENVISFLTLSAVSSLGGGEFFFVVVFYTKFLPRNTSALFRRISRKKSEAGISQFAKSLKYRFATRRLFLLESEISHSEENIPV